MAQKLQPAPPYLVSRHFPEPADRVKRRRLAGHSIVREWKSYHIRRFVMNELSSCDHAVAVCQHVLSERVNTMIE
ncbi:unnamed protein product [Zymoseptoria tritici ST99CH_3D7]|uniref:Uncharacterized protein n=1 Tax=Zymoseptoria tritici (strain ST99CH_3D7) TaxID=1276538 RepID=A0A1X7S182_ZYMT9|nr:unnamed protein product [Zymoseptoria tritici ST99CH_3D7]